MLTIKADVNSIFIIRIYNFFYCFYNFFTTTIQYDWPRSQIKSWLFVYKFCCVATINIHMKVDINGSNNIVIDYK